MDPHSLAVIHGSGQSCYRTPPALISALASAVGGFGVDLAANRASSMREDRFLGPGSVIAEDALSVSWQNLFPGSIGFLNPPYSLAEIRTLKKRYMRGLLAEPERARLDGWIRALRIEEWARKALNEAEAGFTTIGVFPYAPQTERFRWYVMGHGVQGGWRGIAALDMWRLPHRVSYLLPDGSPTANAGVNTCIIHWGPNPGFVGPWVPSGRYWSYR